MLAWLNVYLIYRITMSMHAKNKFLETRTEQEPNKRFRNNLADLFLAGGVSALRTTSLFRDAAEANTENVSDLASVSMGPHAQRDLQRKLLAGNAWPQLYSGNVHILDNNTHKVCQASWQFLQQATQAGICAWRFKPKFHLMQELAEFDQVNPALCWVYRDEIMGEAYQLLPKEEEAFNTPFSLSGNVLAKFCAQNKVPQWELA